ncbi:actin depolymerizing protein [Cystobasidium minutum MCA 4210]|uniref:actin depolymerizing protein n=1 Tax=Cystobasidium minutum MCA 4210 TaxID=1397322 RepID=UPI0034CF566D|eukprot:jgi/Rhomi1/64386/CE64385_3842
MSTQSGISVSKELSNAFQQAQADDGLRALKVVIENEQLTPSSTVPSKGSDADDFDSIAALIKAEHQDTPAYILVKLDNSSAGNTDEAERQWCLCAYVPDNANVRSKMLYSSTKATLSRQLGEAKFKYTLHASTPDELTSEGFKRFLKHQTSQAPMTAREREMADIKLAEGLEAEMQGTTVRRSHTGGNNGGSAAGGAQVGMPWTAEAEEAMSALAKGENQIVQLGIDTKDEKIVLLSSAQDTASLTLPSNDPSYTFYKHATGIVFIYCCPDTSPIRGRMIYSSNCQPIVQDAKQRGIEVVKKLETSTPSEITNDYINQECAPSRDETATPPVSTGFARPARPGRRR